jgi:hypothetical protein
MKTPPPDVDCRFCNLWGFYVSDCEAVPWRRCQRQRGDAAEGKRGAFRRDARQLLSSR